MVTVFNHLSVNNSKETSIATISTVCHRTTDSHRLIQIRFSFKEVNLPIRRRSTPTAIKAPLVQATDYPTITITMVIGSIHSRIVNDSRSTRLVPVPASTSNRFSTTEPLILPVLTQILIPLLLSTAILSYSRHLSSVNHRSPSIRNTTHHYSIITQLGIPSSLAVDNSSGM